MFWKRKSKKKDGQEATDSAAEAVESTEEAEDTAEETTETAAGESDKATGAEKDAKETEDSKEEASDDSKTEESKEEDEKVTDLFADEEEEEGVTGPDPEGITRVRTAGTFEFGDEKFEIVSNTWIVQADEDGVVVIDPAPDAEAIGEMIPRR